VQVAPEQRKLVTVGLLVEQDEYDVGPFRIFRESVDSRLGQLRRGAYVPLLVVEPRAAGDEVDPHAGTRIAERTPWGAFGACRGSRSRAAAHVSSTVCRPSPSPILYVDSNREATPEKTL
jgi:hypothetical protein